MKNIKPIGINAVLAITTSLWLASPTHANHWPRQPFKFDAFNRIPCLEELARIDNYGRELRKTRDGLAVIAVYAGRQGTREGEVVARLFAIRDRLITTNAIDRNRIIIINGGFRENFEIQFWIIDPVGRESASGFDLLRYIVEGCAFNDSGNWDLEI